MNYLNNDKTNQYFNVKTILLNKISQRKKDQYSIYNLCFLKYF